MSEENKIDEGEQKGFISVNHDGIPSGQFISTSGYLKEEVFSNYNNWINPFINYGKRPKEQSIQKMTLQNIDPVIINNDENMKTKEEEAPQKIKPMPEYPTMKFYFSEVTEESQKKAREKIEQIKDREKVVIKGRKSTFDALLNSFGDTAEKKAYDKHMNKVSQLSENSVYGLPGKFDSKKSKGVFEQPRQVNRYNPYDDYGRDIENQIDNEQHDFFRGIRRMKEED